MSSTSLNLVMELEVEKISTQDAQNAAFEIRKQVFVIEQQVDEKEEYDEFEETAIHFLCKAGDKAVGTARWRFTDKGIKLERFAVLADYRGKGVGSAVMQAMLHDLPAERKLVYLHAQLTAMPLYAKFGFKPTGPQFTECEIEHFKMILEDVQP